MSKIDEIKKALVEYKEKKLDIGSLKNLESFINEMKKYGFSKTSEYTIPQPDTIGRSVINLVPKNISIRNCS